MYELIFIITTPNNLHNKKNASPNGIRTRDLWIRSPTRFPLLYRGSLPSSQINNCKPPHTHDASE